MSAYVECQTNFDDQETLVGALKTLGWTSDQIQVHASAQPLHGYTGRARKNTAEVVIGRKHLVGASNDLGFKKQPDGTWKMIISDYDVRQLPRKFPTAVAGTSFQAIMTQAYAMTKMEKNAKSRRMRVKKPDKVRWGEPIKMRIGMP